MMRILRITASLAVLTAIGCIRSDTSDSSPDLSLLEIPVPKPGLALRVERDIWEIVPGTYSIPDNQASVLLKRRNGIGDVSVSSPPMLSIGTSVETYRSYIRGLGNRSVSETVSLADSERRTDSFTFEEWRDNTLCVTQVVMIEFMGQTEGRVSFRGSWKKGDVSAAAHVSAVLISIRPLR